MGHTFPITKTLMAQPFVPWALLAGSSSGSTWVNHVLSSHPCVTSVGEILMRNATASGLFHASLEGISAVLHDVSAINSRVLRERAGTSKCNAIAGGIKLKLGERDVVFGANGNAVAIADGLRQNGFQVFLLQRNNHLDNVLGRLSRKQTGILHCTKGGLGPGGSSRNTSRTSASSSSGGVGGSSSGKQQHVGCDPSALNTSLTVKCKAAMNTIDSLRLRKRASELLFSADEVVTDEMNSSSRRSGSRGGAALGAGRVLLMDYERLVSSPRMWLAALRLLRLPAASRCELRDEHQKRVVQTQRELIRNFHGLSACFQREGPQYARLLAPDRRPASGVIPRDSPDLCPKGDRSYMRDTETERAR